MIPLIYRFKKKVKILRGKKKKKKKEEKKESHHPLKNNLEIETPNGCPLNLMDHIKKISGHEICF
jgi:hypothetical protein